MTKIQIRMLVGNSEKTTRFRQWMVSYANFNNVDFIMSEDMLPVSEIDARVSISFDFNENKFGVFEIGHCKGVSATLLLMIEKWQEINDNVSLDHSRKIPQMAKKTTMNRRSPQKIAAARNQGWSVRKSSEETWVLQTPLKETVGFPVFSPEEAWDFLP